MNDADRKLLTEEVLGETPHFATGFRPTTRPTCSCGYTCKTDSGMVQHINHFLRTFLTPQDSHDVCAALVKKGKWEEFYQYGMRVYKASFLLPWKLVGEHEVSQWLLIESPERTCQLAADFWREVK
jgi:hypothetical protein